MAKNVLNTILKVCTFIMIMWLVSFIPYENIIDPLIFENVNYNTAKTLIFYILGETYPEPYDLLLLYLYILLNIIISIPLLSLVTISTSIYTNNTKHHSCAKEWLASVVRRYMKTFIYSTIFCSSFRLIPYEQIVSNVDKEIILLLIIIFNLVFSTILYFSLVEIVKRTRSHKMPIPPYMWLQDDGGAAIKGSVDVRDREGSIEINSLSHGINLPVDNANGRITGTRQHSAMLIEKAIDSSSPYFYKAAATGQTLKSAEIRFYCINDAGQEVCYYTVLMEDVKVTGVNCAVPNVKLSGNSQINHMETVSLQYEKITWRIVDGNIIFADAWKERNTA